MMKIIIVGCGRQGSNVAEVLDASGHEVTVVDRDQANFARLSHAFRGRTIEGVIFDREILMEAGIQRADGLAAMSDSDEANIVTALMARTVFRVPQVVARIYDPRQRDIYGRLGLQTISPVEIGTTHIVNLLLSADLETLMTIGNGEVVLVEAVAPVTLAGRQVHNLTVPGEIAVVAITRANRPCLPTLGTLLQAGDVITFAVVSSAMVRLKQLLGTA